VTDAPVRTRRQKTATESLLSIALGLEAVLVFFVVLVVFGLKLLPVGVAFGGGAVLFVLLLAASRFVRYPWGVWLGWVLQAVLVALGILLPLMYFIGAVFLAIWIYCFVMGRRLDARNAAVPTTPTTKEPQS
jgi:hypothetical protein